MEYFIFMSSMVPPSELMDFIYGGLIWTFAVLVAYALGHYVMGGLRALWGRR